MTIKDIMTENPACVEVSAPITEVLETLHDLDIRHLPVVNNGELVGLVSDRDLRSFSLPEMVRFNNPEKANARLNADIGSLMSGDVHSVGPEDEIVEVVRMMIDHKHGAVPVVDPIDGRLVGIVSYIDVLRAAEELFEV
jgi:acetoin utilization protein AcuB